MPKVILWRVRKINKIREWNTDEMTLSGVEKIIPVLIWSTNNPTWTGQGLNPVLCRERSAADCLSNGITYETTRKYFSE